MKIKDALPQFNTESALLVVTGKEHAKFFDVRDGEITELESVEVEQDEYYSDKEGRYEFREFNGVAVSGRSVEEHGEAEVKKFLDKLEGYLPDLIKERKPDAIYLFSPSYIASGVVETIPQNQVDLLETTFNGNYSDKHPFDLLEMVLNYREEKSVEPRSEEAQKIYDKFPREGE